MPPRKRNCTEIRNLQEPRFSEEQRAHFEEGILRFNNGRYWHAHESWETAWLAMGDSREDDGEIFLRALIQVASGIHLKRRGRYAGSQSHFQKAAEKLNAIPDTFMGLDVTAIRVFASYQLHSFREEFIFQLRRT